MFSLPILAGLAVVAVVVLALAVGPASAEDSIKETRQKREDARNAQLVLNTNLGWIIDENAERVVLAHGTSTSGETDHFLIPVNCIVARIPLATAKKPKPEEPHE